MALSPQDPDLPALPEESEALVLPGGTSPDFGEIQKVREAFLGNVTGHTRRAYAGDLQAFALWQELPLEGALSGLLGLSPLDGHTLVLRYREALREQKLGNATINRRIGTLGLFLRYAKVLGVGSWTLDIRALPAESYRDMRGPGLPAVQAILDAAQTAARTGGLTDKRDYLVLSLLFLLGLRRGEVSSLDRGHVRFSPGGGGQILVLGKRKGDREPLTLPPGLLGSLREYLTLLGPGEPTDPLFRNGERKREERLQGGSIWRIAQKWGLAVLGEGVRPHGFRHTAITVALDNSGGNIREVQRFSRHQDVNVLTRYDDARRDFGGQAALALEGLLHPPRGGSTPGGGAFPPGEGAGAPSVGTRGEPPLGGGADTTGDGLE